MLELLNARPEMPRRLVLLGARGFVARACAEAAAAAGIPAIGVGREQIDLLDAGAAERLTGLLRTDDALVITSAVAPCRDAEAMRRNVTMLTTVLRAVSQRPVHHTVYISSDAVYADSALVTEGTAAAPSSVHGAMHVAREAMLRGEAADSLAILRPSLLYGPNDPHNGYGPNRFARQAAAEGRIALFGDGADRRDHVFVADLGRLVVEVLLWRGRGVLNVATGRSLPFRAVAELVAACAARPVDIVAAPRVNAVTHRHFDTAAAIKAFPRFRWTPLEEGVLTLRTMAPLR